MRTLITIAALALATLTSQAEYIKYVYSIAFKAQVQEGSGTATTYKLTTVELLDAMASVEYTAGNYPSPHFPPGSQLVYQWDTTGSLDGFCVTDSAGNFICDVRDILWIDGSESVFPKTNAKSYQENLHYDPTIYGFNSWFDASYITTETTTSTKYVCKAKAVVGNGQNFGNTTILTGTCKSAAYK